MTLALKLRTKVNSRKRRHILPRGQKSKSPCFTYSTLLQKKFMIKNAADAMQKTP
jgi:hypothetical protein